MIFAGDQLERAGLPLRLLGDQLGNLWIGLFQLHEASVGGL
jgi:hypothetical protein